MVTSGSVETVAGGQVTVLLYSGRPDPAWPIAAGAAEALLHLWATLSTERGAARPTPAALGYRGCELRTDLGTWHAFDGVVTRRLEQSEEARSDPSRGFERAALATAPAGLVPAQALPAELR
jgi:hypothetical protein